MGSPATDRELVRRHGFKKFIELAWDQIEGCPLILEPHIPLIANHYQMVARSPDSIDMVVNVPPGTSKSTIGSVLFQPWAWTENPTLKFMHTSYDQDLSHDFARRSLHLIQSEWYQARWPEVQVEGGARASVSLFKNTEGGVRFSTMMGGAATGRHAHILVIDDPVKPDDLNAGAESAKLALDEAWTRITDTFSMRRADAGSFKRILVMQRLHVEDPAGRMLKDPDVIHLCLPMEFEPHRAYRSPWGNDWRTQEGELLSPLRFPASVMAKERLRLTPRSFAAQHQQRPTPEAGALFERDMFSQRWTDLPQGMRLIMSVDASLKEGNDSDYCVIQVWGMRGAAEFFLLDQTRRRMSFSSSVQAIRDMKQKWTGIGQILVEDKANGTAIVDTLKRSVPGVLAVNPEGGKMARANAVEPLLRARNVWFPARGSWVEELIEEAISFPVGSHDDQVDAMSQALLWLSGRTRAALRKKAMQNARKGMVFR